MRTRAWPVVDAAAFGFVILLGVGAVLSVAGKLQFPELGSGASVIDSLSAIVMIGLASIGSTVRIGGLELAVLPLGALGVVGFALAFATRRAVARQREGGGAEPLTIGLEVGLAFGVFCGLAAAVFRIRTPPTPVEVSVLSGLWHGLLWGSFFSVLGAIWGSGRPFTSFLPEALREHASGPEARAVAVGLAAAGSGAVVALLLWLLVGLAQGPASFGFAEAASATLYLLAFVPNLSVALLTLGLGGSVETGARLTEAGRLIGGLEHRSFFEWAGGPVPLWVYSLVLIPLVASVLAGIYLKSEVAKPSLRHLAAPVLAAALFTYELAALSAARLGAGLVTRKGVAAVAPEAVQVLLLTVVWAIVGGAAGVAIAKRWGIGASTEGRIVRR